MTPDKVRAEIGQLSHQLMQAGLAIDYNPSVIVGSRTGVRTAMWAGCSRPTHLDYATIGEYRYLIENRQYTLLLLDGSMLQMLYRFHRRALLEHRLCYYPCPVSPDAEDWNEYQEEGLGIVDYLDDVGHERLQGCMRMRSPVRFDYDPATASEDHPASHLHVVFNECRIPVVTPLSVGHFVQFVFRHFYPDLWEQHAFLRSWSRTQLGRTITVDQGRRFHVSLG